MITEVVFEVVSEGYTQDPIMELVDFHRSTAAQWPLQGAEAELGAVQAAVSQDLHGPAIAKAAALCLVDPANFPSLVEDHSLR